MSGSELLRLRLVRWGVGFALLAVVVHLGWEATHGGVRAHHLLARSDLPSVSNWWGLLVLPLLGGVSAVSVEGRLQRNEVTIASRSVALIGSILVGVTLSAFYAAGYEQVTSRLFLGVVATGVLLPIYRPEYLFGFVLGMMFVFGPVIPLAASLFAAGVSFTAHRLMGRVRRVSGRMRRRAGS